MKTREQFDDAIQAYKDFCEACFQFHSNENIPPEHRYVALMMMEWFSNVKMFTEIDREAEYGFIDYSEDTDNPD